MEISGKVYCLFEQSGTFKNEFIRLGIPAVDLDIQNDYGETDYVVDIFESIENAYYDKPSLFDDVTSDDLIFAFFPCIYFCQSSMVHFSWGATNYRNMSVKEKSDAILSRLDKRTYFYSLAIMLVTVAKMRGLRLIMENPWGNTYLQTFVVKPSIIDYNRRLRGDYFKKPTAYWYVNCSPTVGYSFQSQKQKKTVVSSRRSKSAGICSSERSMISRDYARNFICDHVIGVVQRFSMNLLFNE